jgi:hypothetical protein
MGFAIDTFALINDDLDGSLFKMHKPIPPSPCAIVKAPSFSQK